jgi:hypothetical protein
LVERQPSKLNVASSSLVSRSILFTTGGGLGTSGPSSSGVERILGKDEVTGSNPVLGSRIIGSSDVGRDKYQNDDGLLEVGSFLAR